MTDLLGKIVFKCIYKIGDILVLLGHKIIYLLLQKFPKKYRNEESYYYELEKHI